MTHASRLKCCFMILAVLCSCESEPTYRFMRVHPTDWIPGASWVLEVSAQGNIKMRFIEPRVEGRRFWEITFDTSFVIDSSRSKSLLRYCINESESISHDPAWQVFDAGSVEFLFSNNPIRIDTMPWNRDSVTWFHVPDPREQKPILNRINKELNVDTLFNSWWDSVRKSR
jgi:hypothetical protein